jgi:hypothetical protein
MSLEKTGVESSKPVGWPEISRISIPRFLEMNWRARFERGSGESTHRVSEASFFLPSSPER